jgi:hypothetical protein
MAIAKNPSGQEVCLLVDAGGGLIQATTPAADELLATMKEIKQVLLEIKQLTLDIRQSKHK